MSRHMIIFLSASYILLCARRSHAMVPRPIDELLSINIGISLRSIHPQKWGRGQKCIQKKMETQKSYSHCMYQRGHLAGH